MPAFALTVFAGAFLLFQVQPLIAKYILPWFGGEPGVWTTCMLFFQVVLLGGYAYAHFSSRWLKPRAQAFVHVVLLLGALALLPITPSEAWKPVGIENPTGRILALLAVTLGLPYFVLSATGPLMQQWFTQTHSGRSPYRLYALSNAGSLLALVSYPFFFESHFSRRVQAGIWGWGLVGFTLCCAQCAFRVWRSGLAPQATTDMSQAPANPGTDKHGRDAEAENPKPESAVPPLTSASPLRYLLWLLLPACATTLLLATTNKICQDVAVIPFLWVLPLALYLLSFVICFDNPRWYRRWPFALALLGALAWFCWAMTKGIETPLRVLLGGYSACLFVGCMVCHGELYRLRPDPKHLTSFYLMIASGGALGGIFVALIAPLLFRGYHELALGFLLCGLLLIVVSARAREASGLPHSNQTAPSRQKDAVTAESLDARGVPWLAGAMSLILLALGVVMWRQIHRFDPVTVERTRNFHGVLTIFEGAKDNPNSHHLALQHGNTLHGLQFLHPIGATFPTMYYGEHSGVGLAWRVLPPHNRRIGLVGLGIGTLAAYSRPDDYFRFYEINPAVMRLAMKYFTYIPHCRGKVDCVIGDARNSMEKEPPQRFDLLVLDAFSGDAIPAHLLTKEAFQVYARHLNTNAIIAVHTSNNYVDLEPVLVTLAREMKYQVAVIESHPAAGQWYLRPTIWILLSPSQQPLNTPEIRDNARPPEANCNRIHLWTDDHASLFEALR